MGESRAKLHFMERIELMGCARKGYEQNQHTSMLLKINPPASRIVFLLKPAFYYVIIGLE